MLMFEANMFSELPDWITRAHLECVFHVVDGLKESATPYQLTGGLAGNLWGSKWPLQDIDVDVPTGALDSLQARFANYVVRRGRLLDDEFDLELLELNIDGVSVEFSGADDARVRSRDGQWTTLVSTLARSVPRRLADRQVRCQRLEDLIAYKRVLGRVADLRDLERLVDAQGRF